MRRETGTVDDYDAKVRAENRASRLVFVAGAALFCGAEAAGAFISPMLGLAAQGLLLVTLLLGYAVFGALPVSHGLAVLALLPVLRILSLTLPVPGISQAYWYAEISVSLLLAMLLVMRRSHVAWPRLARPGRPWQQAGFALTGLPLAAVAYAILRPERLVGGPPAPLVALALSVSLSSAGLIEELLFRGMVQGVSVDHFGARRGVLLGAALFAACYLGTLSPLFVLFAAAVGSLFGAWVERTGNVWGAAAAHGLLSLGALLVLPILRG